MSVYGLIHCHSEHSLKDGAMSINELVTTAKKMGAKAVTLTDHGSCTGIISFLKKTKAEGIKGIPGVEMYIRGDADVKRSHLLVLAKNMEGYREISRAVSTSNKNIEIAGSYSFPVLKESELETFFGNGNVIVTSACVAGPVANILLKNYYVEKEIGKLEKKKKRYQFSEEEREVLLAGREKVKNKLDALKKEHKKYKDILFPPKRKASKKSLANIIEGQISFSFADNTPDQKEEAEKKLPVLEKEIESETFNLKKYDTEIKKINTKKEKFAEISEEIRKMKRELEEEDILYQKAKEKILHYKSIFGDDFYLEIQYHGLEIEREVYPRIVMLAKETNIPLVCTNDSHIATVKQAPKREFLRSLQNNKFEAMTDADKEMYLKSDHELKKYLSKLYSEDVLKEGFYNIKKICDSCEEIDIFKDEVAKKNLHYPVYIEEDGKPCQDSAGLLRKLSYEGIPKRFPNPAVFDETYKKRLEHELDVIISMGYADYLLIVQDYIDYGKRYSVEHSIEKVGYSIGPGRGSAAGSLVCFLIGITCVDPIKYNLLFERFLNKDRVSMPDIDVDFSEEVREACIEYVRQKYGSAQVAKIRTEMTQAARACIRNAARIISDKYYHDKTYLLGLADRLAKSVPAKPNTKFSSKMSDDSDKTVANYLLETFGNEKHAKEIIKLSQMGEGSVTNLGVHAAGVLISDGKPISEYIPLFRSKTGWAASCDMVECEDIGLLKMDFLGLKNLDIITNCIRRIYRNHNIRIDPENLPEDKTVLREIFAKGMTSEVFQFESEGMKKMLRRFKPDCFEDIILLVAAYRPGPMESIPKLIEIKQKKKKPNYIIPELERILSPTYGQVIYQEQLMDIFHSCAGFSLTESDIIRRYMSKKKKDKFVAYKDKFIAGLIEHGASSEQSEEFWNSLVKFSEYAFNKSHATVYALIAYITAYLKYYYPVEYIASVMSIVPNKKIAALCYECSEMDITIKNVDVNHSINQFLDYPEQREIRYGFKGIKGLGNFGIAIEEERKNGPFLSVTDFIIRLHPKKDVMEALIYSGAFDCFYPKKRNALLEKAPEISDLVSKITKKKDYLIAKLEKETKDAKTEKSIRDAEKEILVLETKLGQIQVENEKEDNEMEALIKEKEYLSAFVSGHPLDSYKEIYTERVTLSRQFHTGDIEIAGMVSNIQWLNRKKDNAEFVIFLLNDLTGSFKVIAPVNKVEVFRPFLEEGRVVRIYGEGAENQGEEEEDPEKVVFGKNIFPCRQTTTSAYLIELKDEQIFFQKEVQDFLASYKDMNGHPVILYNKRTGRINDPRTIKARLSKEILNQKLPSDDFRILPM